MPHIENWPLAWNAAEFIGDHPEQHDQSSWVGHCGTTHCYAGTVAVLAGWINVELYGRSCGERVYDTSRMHNLITGITRDVPKIACDELGIPFVGAEFWQLFAWDNSLYDLLNTLVQWAADDGVTVPDKILAARAVALAEAQEREALGLFG
jgi:hypothetical protein